MQSIISQEITIIDTIIGEIRYLLPSNIMKCFSVSYNTRSTNILLIEHQQTEHQKNIYQLIQEHFGNVDMH